jgi:arsenate reductase-like glutaredoxin family protein
VNKSSTTYRSFGEFLKASDPEAQLAAQPAVMKRPVIEHDGALTLGWDEAVRAKYL